MLTIINIETQNWYISQEKRLCYSKLQGIWALDQHKGCSQK